MNKKEKDKFLPLFIKIAATLLVLAIIFPFTVNYFFANWSVSGTFGDTFGALNALFSGLALAGVIVTILIQRTELKNQRLELSLQRKEMQETRKEFLLNRTTSLVYNQLDRFEKSLSEFTIKDHQFLHKGNDALLYLERNKNQVYLPESDDGYEDEMKKSVRTLFKIYASNFSEIEKLAHTTYTSVCVLQQLVYRTNLDVSDLNDLKNLFFDNIGFVKMGVIERISEVADLQYKYLVPVDYEKNNIDFGDLSRADIFIRSVKEFYQLDLTAENFEEYKRTWLHNNGLSN